MKLDKMTMVMVVNQGIIVGVLVEDDVMGNSSYNEILIRIETYDVNYRG